ncbi:unnamed protein product [Linum tenue]|uniref:J domain-containing protein n=1 Tax=Linum tenue TaxID=586396 RepID=A0AAV0KZM6_9ROSI|nr:unnamed protein product [Linum tenue]
MAGEDEHYTVLGLPSGEDGFKLSSEEIRRAYKRPDDEKAKQKFQKLQSSYQVLKDHTSRNQYHRRLRLKILQVRRRRSSSEPKKKKKQQQAHRPNVSLVEQIMRRRRTDEEQLRRDLERRRLLFEALKQRARK